MAESEGLGYEGPLPFIVQEYFDKQFLSKLGYRNAMGELDALTLQVYRACAKGESTAKPKKR